MPKYNPNSIWTSKKEEFKYEPKSSPVPVTKEVSPNTKSAKPESAPVSEKPPQEKKNDFFSRPQQQDEPIASPSKNHLWIWLGAAVLAVIIGAGFFYVVQPPGRLNLGLSFVKPDQIFAGDPFIITVEVANTSQETLKNAELSLDLPQGISFVGQQPDQRVMEENLNDVPAGSTGKQDFDIIVTGATNVVDHLTAKLTYQSSASSAQFETDGAADVIVGQQALALNITVPAQVFSGQNFEINVNYNNNTGHTLQNATLAMQYPSGVFTIADVSSSLVSNGENSWSLGTLPANASGTVVIKGSLVGPNGASYPIGANLTAIVMGQNYTLANPTASVVLAASPLTLTIAANGSSDYVANTNESVDYVLTFTNNSSSTFQNIKIEANLVGSMFNFASLNSAGTFNSVTNTVTWTAANVPQLASLGVGQSGSVDVRIQTKSAFPIRLLSDKDYTLAVHAQLSSPTVPPGTSANATISVADIATKMGGSISLAALGYWHEPSSQITNSGPYPPRVNQATQYTVHWKVTDYSTDADNVTISAKLESGVTCTGASSTPQNSTLSCNPTTGMVTWQIPVVPATTGITGPPLEAVFQIENTPAVNQIGQTLSLVGPVSLTATDGFTGQPMQASAGPIATSLPNDTSVPLMGRQVTE